MNAPSPPIRNAATVVLLRDGSDGIDAWLLTRTKGMVFAAGMSVFPGGRVDDADDGVPWTGPPPAYFADRFGCSEPLARLLVAAAVRETFEETGVLLTDPPATLGADVATAVEDGTVRFTDLLVEHGLAVDASLLRPWARWITPPMETRRYDTHFFVALLPAGAEASASSTEASAASWVPVRDAVAEAERGERGLLPPTLVTLRSVAEFATVSEVLAGAADRPLEAIEPIPRKDLAVPSVQLPDGTLVPMPRSAR